MRAVLTTFILFLSPLAVKAQVRCEELFSPAPPAVAPAKSTTVPAPPSKEALSPSKSSVQAIPENRPTAYIHKVHYEESGDSFFVVRKFLEETSWLSRFSPHGYDPQGSPLHPFEILGRDLAKALGFRIVNEREIWVPTPETLNRRLAAFNKFLEKKGIEAIPFRFYLQASPKIEQFLRRWSQKSEIPVAAGLDNHTLHDISFHLETVLLPPVIGRLAQIEATLASKWLELSDSGVASDVVMRSTSLIDALTTSANVAEGESHRPSLSGYLRGYVFPALESSNAPLEWATYSGLSPVSLFNRRISHFEKPAPNDEAGFEQMRDYFRQQEEFADRHARVFTDVKAEHPEWTKSLNEMGLTDEATIESLYVNRAAELRGAARDFLREAP